MKILESNIESQITCIITRTPNSEIAQSPLIIRSTTMKNGDKQVENWEPYINHNGLVDIRLIYKSYRDKDGFISGTKNE